MRRQSRVLSLVVAGCLAVIALVEARPPAVVVAAACPDLPVSLGDLVRLQHEPGQLSIRFPRAVDFGNHRAAACLGSTPLRFGGFVDAPEGLGGAQAYRITPGWLDSARLTLFVTSREVAPGIGSGAFTGIYVPPSFGSVDRTFARSWVRVTAHFDDARAQRCRAMGSAGSTPDRAQAVALCSEELVLLAISRSTSPDTATVAGSPRRPAAEGDWLALVAAASLGSWLGWRQGRRRRSMMPAVTA